MHKLRLPRLIISLSFIFQFQDITSVLEGTGLIVRYKGASSKENLVSAVAGAISILPSDGSLRFDLNCLHKTMVVPERKLTMPSLSKMLVGALAEAPNQTLVQKALPQMLRLESSSEKRRIYVSDPIPLYTPKRPSQFFLVMFSHSRIS